MELINFWSPLVISVNIVLLDASPKSEGWFWTTNTYNFEVF